MSRASLRVTPLVVFLPLVFARVLFASGAPASDASSGNAGMSVAVTNCNDSGPGSLRDALARAVSGDTVDLRSLDCSKIILTSGAIEVLQSDISLVGPGRYRLTIDGNRTSAVLRHFGGGWLRIRGLSIANGHHEIGEYSNFGGCLLSRNGSIELRNAQLHHCVTKTADNYAYGGGAYAQFSIVLYNTNVFANRAIATSGYAAGGGVYADGGLIIDHSLVCSNEARANEFGYGLAGGASGGTLFGGTTVRYSTIRDNRASRSGGGLETWGNATISHSTISGNRAPSGGGIDASLYDPENAFVIRNSTISGNSATYDGGVSLVTGSGTSVTILDSTISHNTASVASAIGIFGSESTKSIANSTIAFNHQVDPIGSGCSGVVQADGVLHLESTIVAKSTCKNDPPYDDTPYDIGGRPDIDSVMGANNLVMTSGLPLPTDTITVDPQLASLAANGGRTKTHALLDSSPAIDTGNNAAGLKYDQRGAGYPRVKGAQADIGAYER